MPEGSTSATFEGIVADIASTSTTTVAATGAVNAAAASVSLRPNVPAALSLSSATVASGGSFMGTVTLKAAVAVDTVVQLSANNPLVTIPATVIIPAGSKSATFAGSAGTVSKTTNIKVIATKHGVSVAKGFKLLP